MDSAGGCSPGGYSRPTDRTPNDNAMSPGSDSAIPMPGIFRLSSIG